MIDVSNLTVRFDEAVAVDNVGFEIGEGEVFGLVGESGCGKSTVLRVLAGLNRAYEGRVAVAGMPLSTRRHRSDYRRVQMVFQDPYGSLHPKKTVQATLKEPISIHGLGRSEARIVEALDAVGLGAGFRFRYPHQLSGGQRQRVALARALMLEPDILLLDEPTSALDVSVQAEILNLLADLKTARGLTYLLVSHDLAVVAHMCDRLAVMTGGRIVEHLTVEDLILNQCRHDYTRRLLDASQAYR